MAREGIEPPTPGFSVLFLIFERNCDYRREAPYEMSTIATQTLCCKEEHNASLSVSFLTFRDFQAAWKDGDATGTQFDKNRYKSAQRETNEKGWYLILPYQLIHSYASRYQPPFSNSQEAEAKIDLGTRFIACWDSYLTQQSAHLER
jgi:hypothetical protein